MNALGDVECAHAHSEGKDASIPIGRRSRPLLHRTLAEGCCLLALTTADGHVVFPAFQLHNGRMVRGLPPVLRMLRKGIDDPWTWALWLNSTPPLDGIDPPRTSRMAQLIDGEVDAVFLAAYRAAKTWRS